MKYRFKNCIKYFNFIRSNRYAPIAVKLNVLCSCVTMALLHGCEAFGPELPKGLEVLYHKLIKSALNVRPSTPNNIVLLESGMMPIHALVYKRQLNFYRRLKKSMGRNSVRRLVFDMLHIPANITNFIQHYIKLDEKYTNPNEIYTEAISKIKANIRRKATT